MGHMLFSSLSASTRNTTQRWGNILSQRIMIFTEKSRNIHEEDAILYIKPANYAHLNIRYFSLPALVNNYISLFTNDYIQINSSY